MATSTTPAAAATSAVVETALVVAAAASSPPLPASIEPLTWPEMLAEGRCLLRTGSWGIATKIDRANARAVAADGRVAELEQELDVVREHLQKLEELMAGNEIQRKGLEKQMLDVEDHLASHRDSLRKTFTSLQQLALACGVEATIPQHLDETSVTTALHELVGATEVIPSKHSAKGLRGDGERDPHWRLPRTRVHEDRPPRHRSQGGLGEGGGR